MATKKLHVKKNDTVIVLSGKSKGKKGRIITVTPKDGKVLVEGVNMATKHVKAQRQGQNGGIVHQEAPINACKVMLVCPNCKQPTRHAKATLASGEKVRLCKKCNEEI